MSKNKTTKYSRGMTLVEMIVAIGIAIMGVTGFSLLFSYTWKSNSYTLEMGQTSMAVSQGVNKMVGYIRSARQADNGAFPVKSANDNDFVVYSDYDRDDITERLHFYKSGTNILMGVTKPTNTMPRTYPSGDEQTITVASHIVNSSTQPIFYYYNNQYPGDTTHNPLVTPANVADIKLMKIHLRMNIVPNRDPDNIEMQTFVELRNLNDYDRIR